MGYSGFVDILTTEAYDRWFRNIKDRHAKARINLALRRCQLDGRVVGDVKPVGDQVREMRFHFGPGYRLYFVQRCSTVILLLAGGDKSSQDDDIAMAKRLELQLRKEQQWP